MAFQHRAERFDRGSFHIINLNHAVWVTHRDDAAQYCLLGRPHNIGLFRFVCAKRHDGRLEVRLAHVHAHQLIIGDAEHHATIGRADANITLVSQPFQADKAGETARAVAALVHFAAVRVKNTVVEIEVGIVRRLNHQQLIEPHAQMPIRQTTDQFR